MRRKDFNSIYQFKVSLLGLRPEIWRRIQVPGHYTFWDLHVAIQDCMGWLDYHLHAFRIVDPTSSQIEEIGIPDEDGELPIAPGWERRLSDYFSPENNKAEYEYDFGDSWQHEIVLEAILPREANSYPRCIGGERACPPEDCGGIDGYQELLEALYIQTHDQHQTSRTWAGKKFHSEKFDPKMVRFDNPNERWKAAFERMFD